jgi:hypothetical protein
LPAAQAMKAWNFNMRNSRLSRVPPGSQIAEPASACPGADFHLHLIYDPIIARISQRR